jgi:hypothetical protein
VRGVPAARIAAALVAWVLLAAPARGRETALGDAENPRNVRFDGKVIECVAARPSFPARSAGDAEPRDGPEGTTVTFVALLRDLHGTLAREEARWNIGGRPRGPVAPPEPVGALEGVPRKGLLDRQAARWRAEPGRHAVEVRWGDDVCVTHTDAVRVLLVVERTTFSLGEERFGSFLRRFRKSLDDLHALSEESVAPLAPRGATERFRVDDLRVYDRERGLPREVEDHPDHDLVVVCDEGGPLQGFFPARAVVGHAYAGTPAHRGLWSSWGEQTLWRDLLRSRGVPDYSAYEIADGALPGRVQGRIPLPMRFARDLLASPRQAPRIGEHAAVLVNARRGVGRVGDVEDPRNRHGHVWNWLPGRIDLALTRGGKPLPGATVRWWRARAQEGLLDGETPGVARDRPPDGEATADAAGRASIGGDYLGRAHADRSRWLLVEVEAEKERRFDVLLGLDLNLAYARGHKYVWNAPWRWEDLRLPGTTSPPGR